MTPPGNSLKVLGANRDASEGPRALLSKLKSNVADNRVILVLDDVWTASQLDNLLPTTWGAGSAVVISNHFDRLTESCI